MNIGINNQNLNSVKNVPLGNAKFQNFGNINKININNPQKAIKPVNY
jgi:hypothetical protein